MKLIFLICLISIAICSADADQDATDAAKIAVKAFNDQKITPSDKIKKVSNIDKYNQTRGIITIDITIVDTTCIKEMTTNADSCAIAGERNERACNNVKVIKRPGGDPPMRLTSLGTCK